MTNTAQQFAKGQDLICIFSYGAHEDAGVFLSSSYLSVCAVACPVNSRCQGGLNIYIYIIKRMPSLFIKTC